VDKIFGAPKDFCFGNNECNSKVYISSADWMTEFGLSGKVGVPIYDEELNRTPAIYF